MLQHFFNFFFSTPLIAGWYRNVYHETRSFVLYGNMSGQQHVILLSVIIRWPHGTVNSFPGLVSTEYFNICIICSFSISFSFCLNIITSNSVQTAARHFYTPSLATVGHPAIVCPSVSTMPIIFYCYRLHNSVYL